VLVEPVSASRSPGDEAVPAPPAVSACSQPPEVAGRVPAGGRGVFACTPARAISRELVCAFCPFSRQASPPPPTCQASFSPRRVSFRTQRLRREHFTHTTYTHRTPHTWGCTLYATRASRPLFSSPPAIPSPLPRFPAPRTLRSPRANTAREPYTLSTHSVHPLFTPSDCPTLVLSTCLSSLRHTAPLSFLPPPHSHNMLSA
jgi:hypothetical protein